jgi:hypothetical protein
MTVQIFVLRGGRYAFSDHLLHDFSCIVLGNRPTGDFASAESTDATGDRPRLGGRRESLVDGFRVCDRSEGGANRVHGDTIPSLYGGGQRHLQLGPQRSGGSRAHRGNVAGRT